MTRPLFAACTSCGRALHFDAADESDRAELLKVNTPGVTTVGGWCPYCAARLRAAGDTPAESAPGGEIRPPLRERRRRLALLRLARLALDVAAWLERMAH